MPAYPVVSGDAAGNHALGVAFRTGFACRSGTHRAGGPARVPRHCAAAPGAGCETPLAAAVGAGDQSDPVAAPAGYRTAALALLAAICTGSAAFRALGVRAGREMRLLHDRGAPAHENRRHADQNPTYKFHCPILSLRFRLNRQYRPIICAGARDVKPAAGFPLPIPIYRLNRVPGFSIVPRVLSGLLVATFCLRAGGST